MGFKCKDGLIVWRDETKGNLPMKYENDELSAYLRMLISKVKEEHSKYQYARDIAHYSADISFIMGVAEKNGYRVTAYSPQENESRFHPDINDDMGDNSNSHNNSNFDDIDLDSIVDG